MYEIIYRATGEIGYFMLKSEFALWLFVALCIGGLIGYFLRSIENKSEGDD